MSSTYKPGWESRKYHQLSRTERAAISREVDRRFRMQTGVVRRLDPTSPKDRELRHTWLRIRDAVMNKSPSELAREHEQLIEETMELRRELFLGGLPEIVVEEMSWNGWKQGAELLETWFERPQAIAPKYSAPVTNVIKMDWVLQLLAPSRYMKRLSRSGSGRTLRAESGWRRF
jgi:hypothetical protein